MTVPVADGGRTAQMQGIGGLPAVAGMVSSGMPMKKENPCPLPTAPLPFFATAFPAPARTPCATSSSLRPGPVPDLAVAVAGSRLMGEGGVRKERCVGKKGGVGAASAPARKCGGHTGRKATDFSTRTPWARVHSKHLQPCERGRVSVAPPHKKWTAGTEGNPPSKPRALTPNLPPPSFNQPSHSRAHLPHPPHRTLSPSSSPHTTTPPSPASSPLPPTPRPLETCRALVLDASYRPVDVINWSRAVCLDVLDKVCVCVCVFACVCVCRDQTRALYSYSRGPRRVLFSTPIPIFSIPIPLSHPSSFFLPPLARAPYTQVDVLEYYAGAAVRSATREFPVPAVLRARVVVAWGTTRRGGGAGGRVCGGTDGPSPPLTRRNVLARDGGRCAYCDGPAATIDHIMPVSLGGARSWGNLVAACHACNQRKGARTLAQLGWTLRKEPRRPAPHEWAASLAAASRGSGGVRGVGGGGGERGGHPHPPPEWAAYLATSAKANRGRGGSPAAAPDAAAAAA